MKDSLQDKKLKEKSNVDHWEEKNFDKYKKEEGRKTETKRERVWQKWIERGRYELMISFFI